MRNLIRFIFALIASFGLAQAGWAGGWVLDRYEVTINSPGEYHRNTYHNSREDGFGHTEDEVIKNDTYRHSYFNYEKFPVHLDITNENGGARVSASAGLTYDSANTAAYYPHTQMSAGTAKAEVTVTPVFKWHGGENEQPSKEFWIWEKSFIEVTYGHGRAHDNTYYSEENPYDGQNFSLDDFDLGLGDSKPIGPKSTVTSGYSAYKMVKQGAEQTKPKLISANGKETRGETRTIKGSVTSEGWPTEELGGAAYDTRSSASASVVLYYEADVARFSLDVNANVIQWHNTHPRKKELDAYASKNYLGQSNPELPIEFFWDGYANYSTNITPKLNETINKGDFGIYRTPTYDWSFDGNTYGSLHLTYGRDQGSWPYSFWERPGANVPPTETQHGNTTLKNLHHDLGDGEGDWPQTTSADLKITGGNGTSELTAKAKINWYQEPSTTFTVEVETVAIDLETGEEVNLDSGGEYSTEEAYLAMKEELKGTINGGSEIAGTVLEVAGSFITPDASDVIFPVAGAAGKRVFKLVRGGARIYAVAGRVTSLLASNSGKLQAAARARLGKGPNHPIIIRIREKTTLTGQKGKLPPKSSREPLPSPRTKKKTTYLGRFCFVPGTLVDTQHGKRVIESLKAGDLVWAKDESTGEIALKPIAQTFERVAPSTLALTFSNGETIETTVEHPFYVQDRGFTPAGLVAIGNSIVTRAGPSLEVVKVEKHESPHKVYNFSVEDYHTYFVGESALWTHNTECPLNISDSALKHILDDHTVNGITRRSDSVFNTDDLSELRQLVENARSVEPQMQESTGRLVRIVHAGQDIGFDEHGPARTYSVITEINGDLVTAFPGLPRGWRY